MTDTIVVMDEPVADEHYLKNASINRAILHLCVPMMLAMLAGVAYNIINAYFIGRLNDTSLLAALTFGLPVSIIAFAVGGVFGGGGSAYVGRLLGGGDRARIKHVSAFTLYGALIGGAIISALALIFLNPFVHLLGTDANSLNPTTAYVGMLLIWTPIFIATFAAEQLVRATGATRQSMYGLLISTAGNLVFDVIFILILHMGVTGAALALGISNLLGLAYYLTYLHLKQPTMSLNPRDVRVDKPMIKEVLGVGASELIQAVFLLVSALTLNHVAVQYGPALLAAFGLGLRISQLPEALTMGIGIGMLPLFAYAHGAGLGHRLHAALRGALLWITGIVVIFSGTVFIFREEVFHLFSNDNSLVTYGTIVLTAMLVSTLFNGFTGLFLAYFQGTGRAKAAAILGFALGGFFLPAILVGQALFGADGVIWSLTIGEGASFLTGLALFLTHGKPGAKSALAPDVITEMQAVRVGGELGI